MNNHAQGPSEAIVADTGRRTLRLTRSITATWWYTASGILFFEAMFILVGAAVTSQTGHGPAVIGFVGLGGLVWCASTVPLVLDYRHRSDTAPLILWRRQFVPLVIAAAFGVAVGVLTGIWVLGALPIVQALMLLNWQAGTRARVTLLATLVLVGLSVIDTQSTLNTEFSGDGRDWWLLVMIASMFPALTVLSLWWWDVLVALDRARASESRLAATQERLRMATDVHDLQGHHLQVIALQLELAERLMSQDAEAGMEQLRAARASVADAQQGTRDLATRFRAVPLHDELVNAADLLRAAGIQAKVAVDPDADQAPGSALGPVIRETTTNVLRHGGGEWARLALERVSDTWVYEISNDVISDALSGDGSGLDGIKARVAESGGTINVQRAPESFTVTVTVPAELGVIA